VARQARQVGNLAGVVHAHLDHRGAMRRLKTQQHQRQADVVVEVARGRQHGEFGVVAVGPGLGAQDRGGHLLHRGLAVAAGDADQRDVETGAPRGTEGTQRQARIGDHQQRQAGRATFGPRRVDHRRRGTAFGRNLEERVAVEVLALQRDEQLAAGERPRIGRHPLDAGIAVEGGAAAGQRRFHQAHHDEAPARAASAAAAQSTSENGRRRPPISW
jgi:hypothetical protein